MSEATTVEQIRCSVCKGYLSCSPVRVLPDGNCICGRCSLTNSNAPVYRVLPLEILLSQLVFPCQFKEHGCKKMVLFDQTTDHESKCPYRSFVCPSLTSCTWSGSIIQVHDHFREQHPECIKANAEFKIEMNQDVQQVFTVVKEDMVFIVKYSYSVNEKHLNCDVRYCANYPRYDATSKIILFNDSEPECSTSLKSKKCLPYDDNFYGMQNVYAVDLNKFLPSLDSPDVIAVLVNLTVVRSHTPEVDRGLTVDTLDLHKCKKCYNNLIPPLFNLNENVICYKCGNSNSEATPSNDAELLKRVNATEFPCSWRDCNFVGKSDNFKVHELLCEFRIYKCYVMKCAIYLKRTEIVEHCEKCHGACYLPDKITYKFLFSEPESYFNWKYVFIIKDNEIIGIQHANFKSSYGSEHQLLCFSSVISGNLSFCINLEHQHCKIKSKPFNLETGKYFIITLDQLPPCFKRDEELTVTATYKLLK